MYIFICSCVFVDIYFVFCYCKTYWPLYYVARLYRIFVHTLLHSRIFIYVHISACICIYMHTFIYAAVYLSTFILHFVIANHSGPGIIWHEGNVAWLQTLVGTQENISLDPSYVYVYTYMYIYI